MTRLGKGVALCLAALFIAGITGCAQLGGLVSLSNEPVAETQWQSVATISQYDILASIWDGQQYVAVTDAGEVLVSKDATKWTLRSVVLNGRVTGIAYSGTRYVLIGKQMYSSTALRRWELNEQTLTDHLNAIIYEGGLFWAVGDGGKIIKSPDGLRWNEELSSTKENLHSIAGPIPSLTAVGDNGVILMKQGPVWVDVLDGVASNINYYSVTYGDGRLVAVGAHGTTSTSATGLNGWSTHVARTDAWLLAVTYLAGQGQFVAVGTDGTALVSSDGETWSPQQVDVSTDLWSLLSANGSEVYALGQSGAVLTRTMASGS